MKYNRNIINIGGLSSGIVREPILIKLKLVTQGVMVKR
jgi:hypothetical protein